MGMSFGQRTEKEVMIRKILAVKALGQVADRCLMIQGQPGFACGDSRLNRLETSYNWISAITEV
jgi:hypothetical protein